MIEKLTSIPSHSKVGILGTALTALDIMEYLLLEREDIQLHLMSLNGKFPAVRGREKKVQLRYLTKENIQKEACKTYGYLSLNTVVRWFEKECGSCGLNAKEFFKEKKLSPQQVLRENIKEIEAIGLLQSVIHQMDEVIPDIWNALTEQDKKHYKEEFEARVKPYRSPMPVQTAEKLLENLEKGTVVVHKGKMEVKDTNREFRVQFEQEEVVKYLINATGQQLQVDQTKKVPNLLEQLLNKRIVQPESFGGIQVT